MRKTRINLLVIFLVFSLTACSSEKFWGERNEISNIAFVKVIGIDKTNEGDIRVTTTAKLSKTNEQGISVSNNSIIYTFGGKTVSEASNSIRTFADKMLYYGENDYIILGEGAANDDIGKYLDLLSRWHRSRMNTKLLIVKGGTAESLIKSMANSNTYISEKLDNLFKAMHNLSETEKITLLEFIKIFDEEYSSAYIPYIQINNKLQKQTYNDDNSNIRIGGYAILKGSSLKTYFDRRYSRGLNWINNNINQCDINVVGSNGGIVTLMIINSKTKVNTSIDKGNIVIHYNVICSSNILEQSNNSNIYNENAIKNLENKLSQEIKSEVMSVINYAAQSNNDFLGISDKVYHKYPLRWKKIKSNWNSIFPEVRYEVSVKSQIERSYIITQPNKSNRSDIE